MRKFRNVLASLALVLLMVGQVAAQNFPALTGRVADHADLLTDALEAELTARLSAHEQKSGQQVVVATIQSLAGDEIDGYANRLFRHWGIGDKERNDGVLFLVAVNDRKLRIEVGYGLEGTLTDALAAYIIRKTVVPHFKNGNFATGIKSGTEQILDVLNSDAAALDEWQSRAKDKKSSWSLRDWPIAVFFFIWFLFMFGFPLLFYLVKKFGKKIGPDRYRWLGIELDTKKRKRQRDSGWSSSSGGGGGWSSGGGGFSGGGGSSGGGGASGGW